MNKVYLINVKENENASLKARHFLQKLFGEDIAFKNGEKGKPYIEGKPEIHFNISHTDGLLVIAVSDFEVGIDVEKVREVDMRVKKRFTKDESEYIDTNTTRFFEIWTKKEAFLKQKGVGLKGGLQSFSVLDKEINSRISTFFVGDFVVSVCFYKQTMEYIKITV